MAEFGIAGGLPVFADTSSDHDVLEGTPLRLAVSYFKMLTGAMTSATVTTEIAAWASIVSFAHRTSWASRRSG